MCNGGTLNLASSASTAATVFQEGFNTTLSGWTFQNNSTGGINPAAAAWQFLLHFRPANSNNTLSFYRSSSSDQGSTGTTLTTMQSPAFSTTGYSNMQVRLIDRLYAGISGGIYITNGIVQFSTDGTNWTDVLTRTSGIPVTNFDTTTFAVPAAFENQPTVYLRFSYKATNSPGWWGVDDILITTVKPQTSFSWVSSPPGFTSSLQNPGNVSPSATATYTVSTSNSAGCTATANVKDSIVVVPVFTVSAPVIAPLNLSFNMSYNVSKGHPNKYSIVAAPGGLAGFVNINDATLTSSPITVTTPAHGPGTYNFYITMRDASLTCAQSQQVTLPLSVLNNNNDLSGLSISTGTLSPSFNAATTSYTVTEALGVSSVTVTPTIAAGNAKGVTVNGVAVTSGSASQSIPLTNVTTVISIVVTAQDNSTKTYTVIVTSPANINLVPVTTNAAVAYSLRKLATSYLHAAITPPAAVAGFTNATSPLVRVQRSSDNGQLDIGYTANGDIDTATLKSFASAGDAFVTIWYDQSGNNRDASQNTAASQPRIVHAGVVERKNGRPTVYFYGSASNNVYLSTTSFIGFDTAFTAFAAAGVKTDNSSNEMLAKTSANLPTPWDIYSNTYLLGDGSHFSETTLSTPFTTATPFAIWNFSGKQNNNCNIYLNGSTAGNLNAPNYGDANVPVILGSRQDGATRLDGWISEALIFPAIVSETDRVAVTANETSTYLSPHITSFSPISAASGTVTIKGSSFTGTTAVSFGGTAASFTVVDDNTITATLAGGATGNVVVTNAWGSATKSGFFYGAAPDNAIKLDGASQYATVNTGNDAVTDKFTVEAWVRPMQPAAVSTIFSTRSGADASFDMKLQGGNTIHGDIGDGSSWITISADAGFNYTVNTWYHIAYVVTTTGYTIYANGKAVGGGTFGAGHPLLYNATHTATIGTYAATGEYFGGDIDEVRVYNDALSQAQVQADMQSTAIALPNNLMLYCNFGQASGTSITDFGINNYTVTTIASPTFEESYAMVMPVVKPATNISDVSFTANWQAAQTGTVDKYLLDVATDASFANLITGYNALAVTGTSQQVTGLTQNTSYYYRVRAEKASVTGQGAYSDTASVLTAYSAPVITNFDAATTDVNTTVIIAGSNFSNLTSVTIGGISANVVSNDGSTIYATVPSVNASGVIAVTTLGGTATKGGFYAGNPPANALYFDGVDDNVTLPSATINNFTNNTYEVWVNPASLRGTILAKQKNNVATNSVLSIGYYASAGGAPAEGTPGIVYFRSQNGMPLLASKTALQTGHWYHLAVVFNTTSASIYINGQLDSTVAGDFSIPDISGATTSIGAWLGDGGGQYFNGMLDELRIYNGDRSGSLATDMSVLASSTGDNILSYYTFDAGSPGGNNTADTTLYDVTVNNNNGTLNNFALSGNTSNWVESYAMVIPVAIQANSITGSKFAARWTASLSGAVDKYIVDVSTDSTFATFISDTTANGAATSINITGLQPTTQYFYRVRADKNSVAGQGAYSNIISMRTTLLVTASISSSTATTCEDAASPVIIFKGAGGTGPYIINYRLNGGAIKSITTGTGDSATLAVPTTAGGVFSYSLLGLRDANSISNTATGTATVTVALPTSSSTPVTICSTDLPFNWNGGSFTGAGTYTVHIPNAAGCDSAATLVLTVNQATASSTNVTVCSSALPYNWNGNSYNMPGSYTVHLTNAAGCDSAATLVLAVSAPSAVLTATKMVFCGPNGATPATVKATNGTAPYQYSIDGTNYQPTNGFNVKAGTYTAAVKDAAGCAFTSNTVTIIAPAALLTITSLPKGLDCPANTANVTVNASGGYGGYMYSGDGGSTYQNSNVLGGFTAGTVTVMAKDANGCTATKTTTVTQLTATYTALKTQVCTPNSLVYTSAKPANGMAPYQFSIDGVNYQATNSFFVKTGTYSITIKDSNGCITTSNMVTISLPAAPLSSTVQGALGCAGDTGTITINATGGFGGYLYSIDNGASYQPNNAFNGLPAGTTSTIVKDANGCTAIRNIIMAPFAATYTATKTLACNSGNIIYTSVKAVNGKKPYQYSIDGGANYQSSNVFNVKTGTYAATVKDSAGCIIATNSISITLPPSALAIKTASTNVSCLGGNDGSIATIVTGGYGTPYVYSINGGAYRASNIFDSLQAGTYAVLAKDSTGCLIGKNAVITQPATPCSTFNAPGTGPVSSTGEMQGELKVRVFPNPAQVEFKLQVISGSSTQVVELRVMDMLGKTVYQTRGSVYDTYQFGRPFAGGMYVAEVLNGKNSVRVKLIKGN
jgi:hypothetical protein